MLATVKTWSYASVTFLSLALCGCTAVPQMFNNGIDALAIRMSERRQLAQIRAETREKLAAERMAAMRLQAERDIQLARQDLETQQLEAQFCAANQESLRQRLKSSIQDKVQSRLSFDVTQALEVGELEVDIEELKKLIEAKEKADQEALTAVPRKREALKEPSCGCAEKPCGCKSGLLRKHCHKCRKKSCGCPEEGDCGGPGLVQEALRSPARRPLRPAEIPFKLAIRLSFGMQNPVVENTTIVREALVQLPVEALKDCGCPISRPCRCSARRPCGCSAAAPCRHTSRGVANPNEAAENAGEQVVRLPTPIPDIPEFDAAASERKWTPITDPAPLPGEKQPTEARKPTQPKSAQIDRQVETESVIRKVSLVTPNPLRFRAQRLPAVPASLERAVRFSQWAVSTP